MRTHSHDAKSNGWIGVDLDGTLAHYDRWVSPTHIGQPVEAMLYRVQHWIDQGRDVRIFTARMWPHHGVIRTHEEAFNLEPANPRMAEAREAVLAIRTWSKLHVGHHLPITCTKDMAMIQLWDDRCVQVEPNLGVSLVGAATEANHRDTWSEDIGPVLWWKFPVDEPPYCGTPLDDGWPGDHTHWTLLLVPRKYQAAPGDQVLVEVAQ